MYKALTLFHVLFVLSQGGQSSFGPRPRGPAPHAPQGLDMMAARGPRPLMAPRPLMGSEPWQQMPRGHPGRSPRPLRPGLTVSVRHKILLRLI